MHFTYAETADKTQLLQGDVLERTNDIDALLQQVHPHFHQHPKNLYFMVLTQSCDLADRGSGICKTPYITIAPVRSLDEVVSRKVAELKDKTLEAELPVLTAKSRNKLIEFLQRLFNNNEPDYFFLESSETPLQHDSCAFLKLSIAIKASEHFEKCRNAKILQLTDTFQAKLGWLVGQMYSRVGTRDWDSSELQRKIKDKSSNAAVWIGDDKSPASIAEYLQTQGCNGPYTQMQITQGMKQVPDRKARVLDQTLNVLSSVLGGDDGQHAALLSQARKKLLNDQTLSVLLK